jgi:hypothetical protein
MVRGADDVAGGAVDDADVVAGDEHDDAGAVEGSPEADVVARVRDSWRAGGWRCAVG